MNFYFSGTPRCDEKYQQVENSLCTHRLFSLHGSYERSVLQWIRHPKTGIESHLDKPYPRHIMLDSGAFTSWKSGHHTTVEEVISSYERFFKAAKGYFDSIVAINLDVIPGESGRDPTPQEIKDAIKTSDINYKILTDKFGDVILPVFHQGEPLERALAVEELTDKTSRYICVSPRNDLHENLRVTWAQQVHAALKPHTQTHGLATTGNLMLERVPWYSVDSATWVLLSAYGGIAYYWDTGKKKTYASIAMSTEGGRDRFQGMHFDSYADPYKDLITERAESMGLTIDQLKTDMRARALFCMKNLSMYADKVRSEKKAHSYQNTLFEI